MFFLLLKVKLLTLVVAFSDFRFVEFALRGVFIGHSIMICQRVFLQLFGKNPLQVPK